MADHYRNLGIAFGVGTAASAASGPEGLVLAVPFGAAAAVSFTSAERFRKLANDPPDPNFTELAFPFPFPVLDDIEAEQGITPELADAFNALNKNQAYSIGYERAMLTSIERAQGAQLAGDTAWKGAQEYAALDDAQKLAELLRAQPALLPVCNKPGIRRDFPAYI